MKWIGEYVSSMLNGIGIKIENKKLNLFRNIEDIIMLSNNVYLMFIVNLEFFNIFIMYKSFWMNMFGMDGIFYYLLWCF